MLTQEEVKKYAFMRRLKLMDQIWKDYLQDLMLHLLYKKMPDMVFGGGTCLWKVFRGERFSEDIDAYCRKIPFDLDEYLKKELSLFGISCNIAKKRKTANMLFLEIDSSFPSHPREIRISIEILDSNVKNTEKMQIFSPYPDIPPIDVVIPSKEEMLANKVSAAYRRNRPRDVYDIYILLKLGARIDMKLVKEKCPKFGLKSFEEKISEKKKEWKSLEPLLIGELPEFSQLKTFIISRFEIFEKLI